MQEIIQSIVNVTQAQGFYLYVGMIISVGMIAGSKFDNRFAGFKKSVTLILPYAIILLFVNVTRLYETGQTRPITADAYNGSVSLALITIAYISGLFIGHMVVKKGKEQAHKTETLTQVSMVKRII